MNSRNILFIEDDLDVSAMYTAQLVHERHAVTLAGDAQNALDLLDEHRFDLIILDLLLPGSNGLAVLHELRSYEDWRRLPVIILSNLAPEDLEVSQDYLRELGVSEYLVKLETTPGQLAVAVRAAK